MRVMGLALSISGKKITVAAVILDDHARPEDGFDRQAVSVENSFDVKADEDDLAVRLGDVAKSISGRARSIAPDGVVVRRADRPQRPSNQDGPRLRLLAEGAVTAAVHEVVRNTVIRNGKDCGAAFGTVKEKLDEEAQAILSGKYKEATAAALSGLAGNRMTV
ncbi:hypothetical protein CH251_04980 [Rhodococcus sp. 06-462-5]|uniref:hypothetical protein n=1 Tax=unclassified Rhodococcus (in: high G+C Gram-positive bacteria) TaxID=192944 RepID=UPI000B9AE548|nr:MULTISPECIES: hypothetical protein [unclassified Rhodococcus (in: high G+C Gram-positive bacteria)]OZC78011.1 hypothetical protein CH251_04980 [Rhodococcus sp. 06-462-5]OZE61863.1 hypothetical protein CH270_19370 [Rhodococcus sp. 02-925g]